MKKRRLTIRLPDKLNQWIIHKAQQNNRSLNRQVIFILEKERSADLLAQRCVGNMHLFTNGANECNCGLKVDKVSN